MGRSLRILFSIASAALIGWTTAAGLIQGNTDISQQNTLNVDLCVIGGGAAGTYSAIKSKDLNKTVVIVEQQDRLGGHTMTYVDPISNRSIELGVAEYEDTSIVREWFARFKVPLYQYNFTIPGVTSEYMDFQSGQIATPKQGDLFGAWDAFQTQVAKYPFLDYSLDSVPFPVPADLLLPFGQFITKYNLQDAVPYFSLYGEGWGNFVTLPTLLAIKYFPPSFFNPATLYSRATGALASKDNSLIYEKATKELEPNALLSSTVLSMDRSAADLVKITVQTPSGKKLICAKKLISTIPPLIDNLEGFDLNETEGHSWYLGLVNKSGVPDNVTLINYGINNTNNFNIPVLPGVYDIFATVVPGLHFFSFGSNDSQPSFTQSQVKTNLQDTLTRLRATGSIPGSSEAAKAFNVIDFSSHTPYEVYVSSDQIAKRFYNKLFALQGQRNTYLSGAAFVTHNSAAIWNYTNQLVTKMWSEGQGTTARSLS